LPETVYLGLGSNLGDRLGALRRGLDELAGLQGVGGIVPSPVYETDPVGMKDQPRFLNMACSLHADLEPPALMEALLDIERKMGRIRGEKWGPRIIDLDILLFGDRIIRQSDLAVPHPRMHRRAFVLVPLARIAPEVVHPVLGLTVRRMLEDLGEPKGIRPYPSESGSAGDLDRG